MQPDFRATLYGSYVSTFKGQRSAPPSTVWWDHKYLPLLNGLEPDAPILELGCGDGHFLEYLATRGFTLASGVDLSEEQVALARRRGVRAECGDALNVLAQQANTWRAVIAVDVLEHLTRDELIALAHGMYAALQPRGRLFVQTANGAGLFPGQVIYGDLTHQTVFTPESLSQLLTHAGFVNLRFYETGPIPIRLRGRLNVALWSAIKWLANGARYVETGKRQAIWTENFICAAVKPG
jgi:cyclopropane fatty-acyl-phospholipid synthase-like methyltransferase